MQSSRMRRKICCLILDIGCLKKNITQKPPKCGKGIHGPLFLKRACRSPLKRGSFHGQFLPRRRTRAGVRRASHGSEPVYAPHRKGRVLRLREDRRPRRGGARLPAHHPLGEEVLPSAAGGTARPSTSTENTCDSRPNRRPWTRSSSASTPTTWPPSAAWTTTSPRAIPSGTTSTRRQGAVFVGVSFEPDRFHFSGSVGIDPDDMHGCDVFLTSCSTATWSRS